MPAAPASPERPDPRVVAWRAWLVFLGTATLGLVTRAWALPADAQGLHVPALQLELAPDARAFAVALAGYASSFTDTTGPDGARFDLWADQLVTVPVYVITFIGLARAAAPGVRTAVWMSWLAVFAGVCDTAENLATISLLDDPAAASDDALALVRWACRAKWLALAGALVAFGAQRRVGPARALQGLAPVAAALLAAGALPVPATTWLLEPGMIALGLVWIGAGLEQREAPLA